MRERKTGVEKSKPSGREKSGESGKRFEEKIERAWCIGEILARKPNGLHKSCA